jgi:hypothetical protein
MTFPPYLFLWANFAILGSDPDPHTQLNPDPVQIRTKNISRKCVLGSGSAFLQCKKV